MIILLGKPLFIWFGVLGAIALLLVVAFGVLNKFKYHKVFAGLAILFIALHILAQQIPLYQVSAKERDKKLESKTEINGGTNMPAVKLSEIREFSKEKFLKKVPLETEKIVFNTFFFKPKQILAFHKHPATDELFYVVEGIGEFTVGNEQVIVGTGSAVYGPANTFHGLVNSGDKDMVVISVQGPKPVEMSYKENATIICPVCGQEVILKDGVKEGDKIVCPRCQAKLTISRTKDDKWEAKH